MDGDGLEDLFGVWFDNMVRFLECGRRCGSVSVFELGSFEWWYERRGVFLKCKRNLLDFFIVIVLMMNVWVLVRILEGY